MIKYICVGCNRVVELDPKKAILCPYCGGRYMQKPSTRKIVQLVSR